MKSKIKYIQSLSQKKLRETEGLFVAEGPKVVEEILQASNVEVKEIYATKKWIEENSRWQMLSPGKVIEIDEVELNRISFLQTPNLVLGLFKIPEFPAIDVSNKVSLMLDTIQDPGNLGTIIRCADWFGISQIICSEDCVDAFNPKVVQATMGSISRVQVVYQNLISFIKANNITTLYAATLNGSDISSHQKIREGIILIGNESKGIRPEILSMTGKHITIPRKGKAESLNAAVATGIILSHLVGF